MGATSSTRNPIDMLTERRGGSQEVRTGRTISFAFTFKLGVQREGERCDDSPRNPIVGEWDHQIVWKQNDKQLKSDYRNRSFITFIRNLDCLLTAQIHTSVIQEIFKVMDVKRKIDDVPYCQRAPGFPSGSSVWESTGRRRQRPTDRLTSTETERKTERRKEVQYFEGRQRSPTCSSDWK